MPPVERNKLRSGILARVESGDTLDGLATRLGVPKARVVEAVGADLKGISEMLGEGARADEIVQRGKRFGWSPQFVDLGRRVAFGRPKSRRRTQPQKHQHVHETTPRMRPPAALAEGMRLPPERADWLESLLTP